MTATRVVRESGVWGLDGSRSAKAFLERTTGASGAKIASDLRLAERLATVLPLTAEALREGAITVEHAKVLSRGACGTPARIEALADPERGEGFLLAHAGLPVDQFKTFVAAWAYRVDPDAEDAKRRAAAGDFGFDLAETLDGVHVRGFLTPESGEALSTALTAVIGIPSSTDGRTASRRRHDALATAVPARPGRTRPRYEWWGASAAGGPRRLGPAHRDARGDRAGPGGPAGVRQPDPAERAGPGRV